MTVYSLFHQKRLIFILIAINVTTPWHIVIADVLTVENVIIVNVYYLIQSQEVRWYLNIYDTKTIRCSICQKAIGEVDFDAEIIRPKCAQCSNPIPDINDKIPYLIYQ